MPEIKSHGKLFFDKIVGGCRLPKAPNAPASCSEIVSRLGNNSDPNLGGGPYIWSRSIKTRLRWRGANSSSSGATIAVRPEGRRRINLPSGVIPTKRLRTEPVRRCRARLEFEAIDFFLPCNVDWLEVVGGDSAFA